MATLDTYGLRTALEISKRCDSLCDHLAAIRSVLGETSVEVYLGTRTFTMAIPRETVERELLDKLNAGKSELQALGVTYVEISK